MEEKGIGRVGGPAKASEKTARAIQSIMRGAPDGAPLSELRGYLEEIPQEEWITVYHVPADTRAADKKLYAYDPVYWQMRDCGEWVSDRGDTESSGSLLRKKILQPNVCVAAGRVGTEPVRTQDVRKQANGGLRYVSGTYDISTKYGKRNVSGWFTIFQDVEYGVSVENGKYSVTHLGTGLLVDSGEGGLKEASSAIRNASKRVSETKFMDKMTDLFTHMIREEYLVY